MQGKLEALELLSGVGAGGGAEEEEGEVEVGLGSGIGIGSGRARTFPLPALPPPLLLFSPASFLPSCLPLFPSTVSSLQQERTPKEKPRKKDSF